MGFSIHAPSTHHEAFDVRRSLIILELGCLAWLSTLTVANLFRLKHEYRAEVELERTKLENRTLHPTIETLPLFYYPHTFP